MNTFDADRIMGGNNYRVATNQDWSEGQIFLIDLDGEDYQFLLTRVNKANVVYLASEIDIPSPTINQFIQLSVSIANETERLSPDTQLEYDRHVSEWGAIRSQIQTSIVNYHRAQEVKPQKVVRPKVPNIFANSNTVPVLSNPGIMALMKSFSDAAEGAEHWMVEDGEIAYKHENKDGKVLIKVGEGDLHPIDTIWDLVRSLDDYTGDVLFICLAQYLQQTSDPDKMVWLDADTVLNYRGIKPKKDARHGGKAGHRIEDREKVAMKIQQLANISIHFSNFMSDSKGRPISFESRVIQLGDRFTQPQIDGPDIPLAWEVRPGNWARPFLETQSKQIALLAKMALEYNPYRQDWEKRLARYFTLMFRIRATKDNTQPYKIDTLMREIFKKPNTEFPSRTRDRMEKALDQLVSDHVIGGWQYDTWDESRAERRGWLTDWLNEDINIWPPDEISQTYRPIAAGQKKKIAEAKKTTSKANLPKLF